jgi:predicted SnoaL-like aldol condensation-catalyzing enzyme
MVVAIKDQIRALLKSIETGDSESVAVVNEAKYIQHNPQTQEGSEGNYARRLKRKNRRYGDTFYIDELSVEINGMQHNL